MPFTTIDPNSIQVGDPITKELLDLIKDNMDDHETRILANETLGAVLYVYNGQVDFKNFDSVNGTDIFYYKATTDFNLTDFRIQLFDKQGLTSGTLSFDVQKSTDTNDSNFNTILNSALSFNFASDSDYDEKVASIDAGLAEIASGEVVRVEVTGIPSNFNGKVLMVIGAE
jgi:hypothetical protein